MFEFHSSDQNFHGDGPNATFLLTYFMAEFLSRYETIVDRFINETEHEKQAIFTIEEIDYFEPKLNKQTTAIKELFQEGLSRDFKGVNPMEFIGALSTLNCLQTYIMYHRMFASHRLVA